MAEARLRRPRGRDPLGLRRALSARLLSGLVAAMALLAALAIAGAGGAAGLAARWEGGAAAAMTVQLPAAAAADGRLPRALEALAEMPEVAAARPMDQARLAALLRPWLGEAPALPLPVVIELRLAELPEEPALLATRIAAAVPGAAVEAHGVWVARLLALARSLEAVALAALLLVAGIAVTVVAVAVRAGIAARRDAIALLHDLGATDADIAGRFAARAAWLVGAGGLLGTLLAVPVLAGFANLAAPLLGTAPGTGWQGLPWARLPWPELAALPPLAAALGWATAQATVRRWLRRLP
ncbi:cell division protein FtsX [Siccirubricoccus sp. KC 17139]|uniref:Cell division protein FtsX n=1 Tax=Siccirubricoccus soli TaxID=2899147 RepID=A0ABT1D9G4_9PROT|nr:FtsX-like permease family protein [Siccirubricoccus soli]MCO6418262.1 cell division protein FtsX [Siccirubricoccus soli]MCP2684397.1 cell division protein FtsX [Siccirubricoccus soli]